MEERVHYDLSDLSFNEFVAFLFDHSVPHNENATPWDWSVHTTFDPEKVCSYYAALFRNPGFLLELFSEVQLEQGFWAILGHLDCSAHSIVLEHDEVPFDSRADCIRSMYDLFSRLFTVTALDTSVHMWWDSFCYDWACGKREHGGEDLALQDVFFDTLSAVLQIESGTCQSAALHGLGHLHHPNTAQIVDRFIDEHPGLGDGMKEYARAASRFEVL